MINPATVKAASRLSPRMIFYHLRRVARNVIVPRVPAAYTELLERRAVRVPTLRASLADRVDVALRVATFYHNEYVAHMDEAARGEFTFFGQSVNFGSPEAINWHREVVAEQDFHLWRMKLAHMGVICPMLMSGSADMWQTAERIIASNRRSSSFDTAGCFSSYWFPYSVSHRVLAILSGYIVARERYDLPASLRNTVENFLRWNVAFILANVEHELKNNHVERNLAALCLYYDAVEHRPAALMRRLDRDVRSTIAACILEDGMMAERSAMYQGLAVMALQVFANTTFLTGHTRALARERLTLAERAWAFMSHPDGEIALFNDSWFGEVPLAEHVVAKPSFASSDRLPAAGYGRLENDSFFVLFDAGPIGPAWNPGHGHADFLSAEIDVLGKRFIVDPGTYQYSTGPRRRYERAAQSHNGPCWSDVDPVEYHGCFKVGRMAAARLAPPSSDMIAGVEGSLRVSAGLTKRRMELRNGRLHIVDCWHGKSDTGAVHLTVQGEWRLLERGERHLLFACENEQVTIAVDQGTIGDVRPGAWARKYLQSEDALHITLIPHRNGTDGSLHWSVAREGSVAGA